MNVLKTLIDTGERIATAASWVSGALLFATTALIAVEVVLRKAFAVSIGGADELSCYAMAISCSWAFAFALYRKAHIRIDVVYMRLSRTMQHFLDIFSLALFALFMTVLAWFGVLVILLIEMALITPPVGLNLYVVQGVRGRGSINEVIMGSAPFVVMIFIMIALLVAFPELALVFSKSV